MDERELKGIDLNLLIPLRALLAERHITNAARRIGLSQPTMSRTLARLREQFADPLLVSTADGLRPTARAQEIEASLDGLLLQLDRLFSSSRFDPKKAVGEVRFAAPDVIAYMLLPRLISRLRSDAPLLNIHLVQWKAGWRQQLESGDIDVTIGQPTGQEPGIYQHVLTTIDWVCALRTGHPCLQEEWTPEVYAKQPHLLVTTTGRGPGQVDDALNPLGLSRNITLRMPYGLLSPLIVAESDLVLTTSRWIASKLAAQVPLVVRPVPVKLEPIRVPMVWHERSHQEPRARWVRDIIVEISRSLDSGCQTVCMPEVQ